MSDACLCCGMAAPGCPDCLATLRSELERKTEALREAEWLLNRALPKGTLKRAGYEEWLRRNAAFSARRALEQGATTPTPLSAAVLATPCPWCNGKVGATCDVEFKGQVCALRVKAARERLEREGAPAPKEKPHG